MQYRTQIASTHNNFNFNYDNFNKENIMIKRIMFAGLFCLASSTASNAQSLASTGGEIQNALDANSSTRWTTGTSQVPGQIFQIDLGRVAGVSGITLSNCGSPGDHPVSLAVLLSLNGSDFFPGSAGSTNGDPDCTTTVRFDQQEARFIFLQQTGNGQNYWSIHEVDIETDEPTVQILRGDSGNLAAATNTGAFSGQNIFQFTPDRSDGNQLWTEIDRGDGFFSYAKLNTTFCIDGGNGGANQWCWRE